MRRARFHQADGADIGRIVGPNAYGQTIIGTAGDDALVGTIFADSFDLTQGGSDSVAAGSGRDFINLGSTFDSTDRINGGDDFDTLQISGSYPELTITGAMFTSIEFLNLTFSEDSMVRFTADAGRTYLPQVIVLSAAGTTTTINATAVSAGIAAFSTGPANLHLLGGSGNDWLDVKYSATGDQLFRGGGGIDKISFSSFNQGVSIDLRSETSQAASFGSVTVRDVENVTGTSGDDKFIGTDAANWIGGGGGGTDRIIANGGDDVLLVGRYENGSLAVRGLVNGGAGTDLIAFYGNPYSIPLTLSLAAAGWQDTGNGVYALKGIEDVWGTYYDDTVRGNYAANRLLGDYGDDHLNGGGGDDVLAGDGYVSSAQDEPLTFGYTSRSGYDHNQLDGGTGNDTIYAGNGGDLLIGGLGADTLHGGHDADRFAYFSINESKVRLADTIIGWSAGDLLDVSAIDADTSAEGRQAFHFGTTAARAGDIVVRYDPIDDVTMVDFYVNGDKHIDMTINLVGNLALTEADFVF